MALFAMAGFVAIAQPTPSFPHGTSGGTCSLASQQTEASQLASGLTNLVGALPAAPGGNYSSQGTRDLMNGGFAGVLMNNSSSASRATANFWVKEVFKTLNIQTNPTTNVTTYEVPQDAGNTSSNDDTNYTEFAFLGLGAMMQRGDVTIGSLLDANNAPLPDIDPTTNKPITNSKIVHNMIQALGTLAGHTASGGVYDDTYTNMWLMNTIARILMDEALITYDPTGKSGNLYGWNASTDLSTAETNLTNWLNEVKTNGIHEFDSPTYSGTQLQSLILGLHYVTGNANVHADIKTALDYEWLDLSTNFFLDGLRVPPPYSRNYDIVSASGQAMTSKNGVYSSTSGELLPWIEVMGCFTSGSSSGSSSPGTQLLTANSGAKVVLEHAALYDSVVEDDSRSWTGYQLETSSYALATTASPSHSRQIWQNWHDYHTGNSNSRRVVRLGQGVSMGCASGAYSTHDQDTMVGAMLGGNGTDGSFDQNLGLFSVVVDSSGNPYGTPLIGGKPWHLQENAACAMGGRVALVSFSIDGSLRLDPSIAADTGLSTNILFPYDPTTNLTGNAAFPVVKIDNKVLTDTSLNCTKPTSTSWACPLTMGTSVVAFNRPSPGRGVIGFKLLESSWLDPNAGYQLEIDQNGSKANPSGAPVSRIVIAHTRSAADGNEPTSVHVAMAMMMDDTTGSSTGVYNTLKSATFSESGAGTSSLTQQLLFPSYKPLDESGNTLNGLQIVRPDAGPDDNILIGAYSKEVYPATTFTSIGINAENLHVVDGTGAGMSGSGTFWTAKDGQGNYVHPVY